MPKSGGLDLKIGGWGVSGGDFHPPNGGFGGPSPQPWSRLVKSGDISNTHR